LDDGMVIAEVAAIAEYIEEIKPDPVLSGNTAGQRAETRMRMRQLDYLVLAPMMAGYRHSEGKGFFEGRMLLLDDYGAPSKQIAAEGLKWVNNLLADKPYICGDRLTYVDVAFYCLVGFLAKVSLPIDPSLTHLTAYFERLSQHEIIGQK
jgi:glutathione S-transferase